MTSANTSSVEVDIGRRQQRLLLVKDHVCLKLGLKMQYDAYDDAIMWLTDLETPVVGVEEQHQHRGQSDGAKHEPGGVLHVRRPRRHVGDVVEERHILACRACWTTDTNTGNIANLPARPSQTPFQWRTSDCSRVSVINHQPIT